MPIPLVKEIFSFTQKSIETLEKNAALGYTNDMVELIYRYYSEEEDEKKVLDLCEQVLVLPCSDHAGIKTTEWHHAAAAYVKARYAYLKCQLNNQENVKNVLEDMLKLASFSKDITFEIYELYKKHKDLPYADIKAMVLYTSAAIREHEQAREGLSRFFEVEQSDFEHFPWIDKEKKWWLSQLMGSFVVGIEDIRKEFPSGIVLGATYPKGSNPKELFISGWSDREDFYAFTPLTLREKAFQKNSYGVCEFLSFSGKHGLLASSPTINTSFRAALDQIEDLAKQGSDTALIEKLSFTKFKFCLDQKEYQAASESFANLSLVMLSKKKNVILDVIAKNAKPDDEHWQALNKTTSNKLLAAHVNVAANHCLRNPEILKSVSEHEARAAVIAHLKEAYGIYTSVADKNVFTEQYLVQLFGHMLAVQDKDFTEYALIAIESHPALKIKLVSTQLSRRAEENYSDEEIAAAFMAFKQKYHRRDQLESFKALLMSAAMEKLYGNDDWFLKLVDQHDQTNPQYDKPELHELLYEDVFKLSINVEPDSESEEVGEDNSRDDRREPSIEQTNVALDIFNVIPGDKKYQFAETKQLLLKAFDLRDGDLNERALSVIREGKMKAPFVYVADGADQATYDKKFAEFAYWISVRSAVISLYTSLNSYIDYISQHREFYQKYSDVLPFFHGVRKRSAFKDKIFKTFDFYKLIKKYGDKNSYDLREMKAIKLALHTLIRNEGSRFKPGIHSQRLPDLIEAFTTKLDKCDSDFEESYRRASPSTLPRVR